MASEDAYKKIMWLEYKPHHLLFIQSNNPGNFGPAAHNHL